MSVKSAAGQEPVLTAATITALVGAVVGLLVAFGLDLNKDQVTALGTFTTVVAPLIAALVARRLVTPVVPDTDGYVGDHELGRDEV